MAKVFGIGLNKTGTRSVAAATRLLGLRTLHKGDAATSALVDEAAGEGRPLLTLLGEQYDAYFDVDAITRRFSELDLDYPGSRFILTTRPLDGWLASREKHVLANQRRAETGRYPGAWLTVDREAWVAERESHHAAVEAYFSDRPGDLLIFDLVRGDSWPELAGFLGKREPTSPFPWENEAGEGTYSLSRWPSKVRKAQRTLVGRARRVTGTMDHH